MQMRQDLCFVGIGASWAVFQSLYNSLTNLPAETVSCLESVKEVGLQKNVSCNQGRAGVGGWVGGSCSPQSRPFAQLLKLHDMLSSPGLSFLIYTSHKRAVGSRGISPAYGAHRMSAHCSCSSWATFVTGKGRSAPGATNGGSLIVAPLYK